MITELNYYLPAFLQAGDVQGAIDRIEAIASLERKRFQNVSVMTRYNLAFLKTFQGEYTAWIEINGELKKAAARVKTIKAENKQKREAQHVAHIQQHLQSLALKENEKDVEVVKPTSIKSSLTPEPKETVFDNDLFPSSKEINEAKEEKKKNHERNETLRKEKEEKKTSLLTVTAPLRVVEEKKIIEEILPSLRSLYALSHTALRVDDEIF